MAWYSFITDNPVTRTVGAATNFVAEQTEAAVRFVTPDFIETRVENVIEDAVEVVEDLADAVAEEVTELASDAIDVAEDVYRAVTPDAVEEFIEEDIPAFVNETVDGAINFVEETSFDYLSFVLGGDDDARQYIADMQQQYGMAWDQLQNGDLGAAFGSVVDAQFLAAGHVFFDPDNDTWLSIAGNYTADAGQVFHDEGVLHGTRLLLWEGAVKGSIGVTIEGIIDLPDTIGDLTGWYNLYDGSVGEDVSSTIWYSWTGGRYEAQNENEAKLLGIGTAIGDVASLVLTFGAAGGPKVAGWLGRAGKFASAADTAADAVRVTSRTRQIMTGVLAGTDVITTTITAPLAVAAEIDRYNEGQLMDVLEEQLQQFEISQEDIDAAHTPELRYELYIDTVKDTLVEFGEDREELDGMEPQQIEDLFNEYFLLIDAIENPDSEPPRVPADDRIEQIETEREEETLRMQQEDEERGVNPLLRRGSFGADNDQASYSGPGLTSDISLNSAFLMTEQDVHAATMIAAANETGQPLRFTPGGIAA